MDRQDGCSGQATEREGDRGRGGGVPIGKEKRKKRCQDPFLKRVLTPFRPAVYTSGQIGTYTMTRVKTESDVGTATQSSTGDGLTSTSVARPGTDAASG